ncbi:MAG: 5'-nucleotidase [Gammaproteobacteria bacterium]|jgi:5'-nucleotidase|nr:5'-nucleotidase [Pseudomonadota bacterium]NCX30172.1 5'-nucleotidase [Pseudomonadota bacterium]NCX33815.1 5'-nucleotidase [Pseudomonadota bacterium]
MDKQSKLIIGISSRALFNLDQSHEIYEKEGLESYRDYQIANEDVTLEPGEAFSLVKKILSINSLYKDKQRIEVILLSRNTSDTGLRIRNSIEAHGLDISRAAFCGGESPHRYVRDFGVHLFLSSSFEDVKLAIESNVAAATIIPRDGDNSRKLNQGQLKIAFDGDAVIFSDDSEKVFHEDGLDAFIKNEVSATSPLKAGPFKSFLVELNKIQNDFDVNECPIRTALVTARSAPSDKRVIKTLREWGVRIDESLFLGGMSKQQFLKSFQADIFFDDQKKHIMDAVKTTASGHVPYGVKNK